MNTLRSLSLFALKTGAVSTLVGTGTLLYGDGTRVVHSNTALMIGLGYAPILTKLLVKDANNVTPSMIHAVGLTQMFVGGACLGGALCVALI